MRKSILLLSIALWLGWSPAARAQLSGQFVGAVTDPSGSAVPEAKITVIEMATGFSRSVTAGAEGFYSVPSLRPAVYKITVAAPGFRTSAQEGITLEADQSATVNFKLILGAVTETVSITASAVQVDTSTGTIKQVIDSARIVFQLLQPLQLQQPEQLGKRRRLREYPRRRRSAHRPTGSQAASFLVRTPQWAAVACLRIL